MSHPLILDIPGQTSLEKIQVLQNNIIRIMNFKFVKDKAKMCVLFKFMKILKVKEVFELEIAKFMYSHYHSKLPQNFDNYFQCASQRWSPLRRPWSRGHILKSLALASKPQVLGLGLDALGPQKLPSPRLEDRR